MTGRQPRLLRIYHSGVVEDGVVETLSCDDRASRSPSSAPSAGTRADATSSLAQSRARTSARSARSVGTRSASSTSRSGCGDPCAVGPFDVIDIHEEPASLATLEIWVPRTARRRSGPRTASTAPRTCPSATRCRSVGSSGRCSGGRAAVHTCNEEAGETPARPGLQWTGPQPRAGCRDGPLLPAPRDPTRRRPGTHSRRLRRAPRRTEGCLRAARRDRRVEHASLSYVGAGDAELTLAERIIDAGLSNRVAIRGFVDQAEPPSLYRRFDVVVVPSLTTPTMGRAVRTCRGRGPGVRCRRHRVGLWIATVARR